MYMHGKENLIKLSKLLDLRRDGTYKVPPVIDSTGT